MHSRLFLVSPLALMILAVGSPGAGFSSCPKRGDVAAQRPPAVISLHLDRSVYALEDSIVTEVAIRNGGADPLFLFNELDWHVAAGMAVKLFDSDGNWIQTFVDDPNVPGPPPSLDDPTMFVRLRKGDFFGNRRVLKVRDLVRSPGEYRLSVWYVSNLPCNILKPKLQMLPAIWSEHGIYESQQVRFTVVP